MVQRAASAGGSKANFMMFFTGKKLKIKKFSPPPAGGGAGARTFSKGLGAIGDVRAIAEECTWFLSDCSRPVLGCSWALCIKGLGETRGPAGVLWRQYPFIDVYSSSWHGVYSSSCLSNRPCAPSSILYSRQAAAFHVPFTLSCFAERERPCYSR